MLLRAMPTGAGRSLPLGDFGREASASEVVPMIRSRALVGTLMVVIERARVPTGCTSKSGPSKNGKIKYKT